MVKKRSSYSLEFLGRRRSVVKNIIDSDLSSSKVDTVTSGKSIRSLAGTYLTKKGVQVRSYSGSDVSSVKSKSITRLAEERLLRETLKRRYFLKYERLLDGE